MTVYKENDNGCDHDYDEIGKKDYSILYWCPKCGALRTLYPGSFSGPESYTRIPKEGVKYENM